MTSGCLTFCADLVFTGGMATVATGLYDAYKKCTDAIDEVYEDLKNCGKI